MLSERPVETNEARRRPGGRVDAGEKAVRQAGITDVKLDVQAPGALRDLMQRSFDMGWRRMSCSLPKAFWLRFQVALRVCILFVHLVKAGPIVRLAFSPKPAQVVA
jgi:hypothetical protein